MILSGVAQRYEHKRFYTFNPNYATALRVTNTGLSYPTSPGSYIYQLVTRVLLQIRYAGHGLRNVGQQRGQVVGGGSRGGRCGRSHHRQ